MINNFTIESWSGSLHAKDYTNFPLFEIYISYKFATPFAFDDRFPNHLIHYSNSKALTLLQVIDWESDNHCTSIDLVENSMKMNGMMHRM